jgi:hypothetical protein
VVVLIWIAVVVVLAVVIAVAMGRGGGLSVERSDYRPLDLGPVSATDVALLRPPSGLWGYNVQATDEAMDQIAQSIRERDVRIVALEQLVTDLSRDHAPMPLLASPYSGARHRRLPGEAAEVEVAPAPPDTLVAESPRLPPYVSEGEPARPPFNPPATESGARPPFTAPATEMPRPPFNPPATEPARLPFEPDADLSGPPPEQSHD